MPISKIGTNGLNQTDLDLGLSGNVGIGTATPVAKLNVSTESSLQALFGSTSTSDVYIAVREGAGEEQTILGSLNGTGFVGTSSNNAFGIRTNNAERVNINSVGVVTIPNQPAFFARKTNGGAMAPVTPVLFNDVVTNIGSHYNAATGRFTAPVTGNYYFISMAHCETTNNSDRKLSIFVNGSMRADAYILNATSARTRVINAAILSLNVNDYVTIGSTGAGDLWAGDTSGVNFTGFLIG